MNVTCNINQYTSSCRRQRQCLVRSPARLVRIVPTSHSISHAWSIDGDVFQLNALQPFCSVPEICNHLLQHILLQHRLLHVGSVQWCCVQVQRSVVGTNWYRLHCLIIIFDSIVLYVFEYSVARPTVPVEVANCAMCLACMLYYLQIPAPPHCQLLLAASAVLCCGQAYLRTCKHHLIIVICRSAITNINSTHCR